MRSLRSAAKQDELLPQRQVLEREVSAGSERRTQRAQQTEYEGHCPPWLARRWAIVQSLRQDFGKRQRGRRLEPRFRSGPGREGNFYGHDAVFAPLGPQSGRGVVLLLANCADRQATTPAQEQVLGLWRTKRKGLGEGVWHDTFIAGEAAYMDLLVSDDKNQRKRCDFLRERHLLKFKTTSLDDFIA